MEQKNIIANNLTAFRKHAGLTQQELADHLNYSDKAVSKWERGEAIPDVLVLKQIADYYGVTLNDILSETIEPSKTTNIESRKNRNIRHLLITLLSVGLLFFISTIANVVLGLLDIDLSKEIYLLTLPGASIILIVFSCIWGTRLLKCLSVTSLIWTACLNFHILIDINQSWLIYLIGAALQVLVILWYLLLFVSKNKRRIKRKKKNNR